MVLGSNPREPNALRWKARLAPKGKVMNNLMFLNSFVSVAYVVQHLSTRKAVTWGGRKFNEHPAVKEIYLQTTTSFTSKTEDAKTTSLPQVEHKIAQIKEESADENFNNILSEIKKLGDDFEETKESNVDPKAYERKPNKLSKVKKKLSRVKRTWHLNQNKMLASKVYSQFGIKAEEVDIAYFNKPANGWSVPRTSVVKKYMLLTGAEQLFLIRTEELKDERSGYGTAFISLSADSRTLYRKGQVYHSKIVS